MGQELGKKGDEGEDKLHEARESERLLQKEIPIRHGQGCKGDGEEEQEGPHRKNLAEKAEVVTARVCLIPS